MWEMQIDSGNKMIDYKNILPIKPHSTLRHRVQVCLRLTHLPPAASALHSGFHANSGAGELCFCSAPALKVRSYELPRTIKTQFV